MKHPDKNEILESFDDITEAHFLNARLQTLTRIRENLLQKVKEIDCKIRDLKQLNRKIAVGSL